MTDRVTDILSGLPAGSLEPQLRASIEQARRRKHFGPVADNTATSYVVSNELCSPRDVRFAHLAETIRRECAYALEPIANSIISPAISRIFIERAIASLGLALEAAAELYPPSEAA